MDAHVKKTFEVLKENIQINPDQVKKDTITYLDNLMVKLEAANNALANMSKFAGKKSANVADIQDILDDIDSYVKDIDLEELMRLIVNSQNSIRMKMKK